MITIEVKGLKGVKRAMNRLEKKIPGTKKKLLREFGMKIKNYAKENIQQAGAVASGTLLKSIHRRTTNDQATVWTDSPISGFWEFGVKPHWVHRGMISPHGYSVGEWMRAHGIRGNYMFVGAGTPIGKPGIKFMTNALIRIEAEAPHIVDKYARDLIKK